MQIKKWYSQLIDWIDAPTPAAELDQAESIDRQTCRLWTEYSWLRYVSSQRRNMDDGDYYAMMLNACTLMKSDIQELFKYLPNSLLRGDINAFCELMFSEAENSQGSPTKLSAVLDHDILTTRPARVPEDLSAMQSVSDVSHSTMYQSNTTIGRNRYPKIVQSNATADLNDLNDTFDIIGISERHQVPPYGLRDDISNTMSDAAGGAVEGLGMPTTPSSKLSYFEDPTSIHWIPPQYRDPWLHNIPVDKDVVEKRDHLSDSPPFGLHNLRPDEQSVQHLKIDDACESCQNQGLKCIPADPKNPRQMSCKQCAQNWQDCSFDWPWLLPSLVERKPLTQAESPPPSMKLAPPASPSASHPASILYLPPKMLAKVDAIPDRVDENQKAPNTRQRFLDPGTVPPGFQSISKELTPSNRIRAPQRRFLRSRQSEWLSN